MDRISDVERQRIAELLAEGAPVWRLHQEINRSRHAIRRAVIALHRPDRREPRRSPLRLSLAEREEISRGLVAGESLRGIAGRITAGTWTECVRPGCARRARASAFALLAFPHVDDLALILGELDHPGKAAGALAEGFGTLYGGKMLLRFPLEVVEDPRAVDASMRTGRDETRRGLGDLLVDLDHGLNDRVLVLGLDLENIHEGRVAGIGNDSRHVAPLIAAKVCAPHGRRASTVWTPGGEGKHRSAMASPAPSVNHGAAVTPETPGSRTSATKRCTAGRPSPARDATATGDGGMSTTGMNTSPGQLCARAIESGNRPIPAPVRAASNMSSSVRQRAPTCSFSCLCSCTCQKLHQIGSVSTSTQGSRSISRKRTERRSARG